MYFHIENKKNACEIHKHSHRLSEVPHLHSHIEMVLVHDGKTEAIADTKHAIAEKDDIFIAFPNQIHYYLDKTETVLHDIIIFSADMCPEFSRILGSYVLKSPVLKGAGKNPKISSSFENILECVADGGEYSETEIRGSMLVLLSEMFRNAELVENASYDMGLAKDIINYCYDNYNTDISLNTVAHSLHVSRYYVSRLFSSRLNIGFNSYINSLRIRRACEMLKTNDRSVTEIAGAVGYNSVRTFDRCFAEIRGMSPKEYRKNVLAKKDKEKITDACR
jgi:putative transcriptional regulator yfiF